MTYRDARGTPLERGDLATIIGSDMTFRIVDMRPEQVAVIRNTAPGYPYTSTVPLHYLTRISGEGPTADGGPL
jgi:hypothetical protein